VTAADLVFNADLHVYTLPSGARIPSVTEILKRTGVSTDFEALPNRDAITRKRDIGSACHADAHAYDDGDLDWSTVHPDVRPYLDAWCEFRRLKQLTPTARERRVLHPSLGYCGTFDGIFTTPDLEPPVLVDMKLGDPKDAAAQFQTAGYLLAHACEEPDAMRYRRWSVQLLPERRVPFIITQYADWTDFQTWQAIVTTFYAQRRAL